MCNYGVLYRYTTDIAYFIPFVLSPNPQKNCTGKKAHEISIEGIKTTYSPLPDPAPGVTSHHQNKAASATGRPCRS